ncbi:hypothetical protein TWF281_006943 [Arthrobotrys megalospora]
MEAKIRHRGLYNQLEVLDWKQESEGAFNVTDEVVSLLMEHQLPPKRATDQSTVPELNPSTDRNTGVRLFNLIQQFPELYETNEQISKVYDQIRSNDESLAKVYFLLAALHAGLFGWSWELNIPPPGYTATTFFTAVAGGVSVGLYTACGVYIASRVEKLRRQVEQFGDVNNRTLEIWKGAQEAYSHLKAVGSMDWRVRVDFIPSAEPLNQPTALGNCLEEVKGMVISWKEAQCVISITIPSSKFQYDHVSPIPSSSRKEKFISRRTVQYSFVTDISHMSAIKRNPISFFKEEKREKSKLDKPKGQPYLLAPKLKDNR